MIDSPRSAAVRRVAALKQKSRRQDAGLLLLEGPQVVREALLHAAARIEHVYVTAEALAAHPELGELARTADVPFEEASPAALAAMADTRSPQGVVAVATDVRADLETAVSGGLVVLLDEVRDPGNAGTIIRAADAAGADGVVLVGDAVDLGNPKTIRSTTGSLFHLPIATGVALPAAVAAAKAAGLVVLAADMGGEPLPALGRALAEPTAWLFGNEARGLSAAARRLADRTVAVPIYGSAESMNLATAASVCLYASAFARRA